MLPLILLEISSNSGHFRQSVPPSMIGKTIGKYRVEALLGEGGMGIVYKAVDTEHDRVVALKILNRDAALDPDVRKRFLREAGAGAGLVHPNIVQVFDTGTYEGQYYLCLEFVEGKNLRDILADGPLQPQKVVEIGMAVANALGFAHGMGVIHRDIKAENIMLTPSGGVKIMDFGLAKLQGASMLTREGDIVGTVAYMSPEQATGELVDQRTDIFSLGVVLYELLTGKLPFWAAYETAIVYSILNTEPVGIRELRPEVPEALEQIVFKALRKEQSKRYQKMDELTGDLARVKAYFDGEREVLPDAMELTAGGGVAKEEIWGSQIRLAAKAGFAAALAGREKEFALLKERLQRAHDGSCQLLLLGGEAGIGKTRLVEELESFAKTLRVRTLRGACPRGEGAYPYQPFVEAIREYLQNKSINDPEGLNAYIKELAPDLVSQLPAIRVFVNMRLPDDVEPGSREELWDVAASLLRSFSQERPLLLFVDDLQNVDEDSYLFLTQILHRCASARLLVIGSYRSEEVRRAEEVEAHPVERLRKEFEADEKFFSLELGRLTPEAVQAMARSLFADADFGAGFYESLHRETEGNPFFVVETLKLLKVEGIIEKRDGQFVLREAYDHLRIPKSIHDIVMRRIDRLKEDEREILEIGAVEGESFRSGTVGHCLELGRIRLLKKLQSLERDHHIIHPEENAYRFDHGKIREFLYEAITPELRTEYHRMIGAYLIEEFGTDQQIAGQIAFHLTTGGQDEQAVPYLTSAGDRARRLFANKQAVTQYEKALGIIRKLEVARPGAFAKEKEYATEGLADIWSLTGEHESAISSYGELASLPTATPLRRSELLRKIGGVYMTMGNNEKALELLQGSERELDKVAAQGEQNPEIKKALGKTRITRSRVFKTLGRYDDAKMEVEGGLALLPHNGSDRDLSEAYNNLGVIYEDLGAFDLSESMYKKNLEVLEKVGDKKGIAIAYNNLANLSSSRADYRLTAEYLKKSLDLMTEIGYRSGIAGACNNLGSVYQDQGRYDEARKMHERCLVLREEIGDVPGIAMSHGNLGSVLLDLGDYGPAKEHLETSIALFSKIGERVFESQLHSWLAMTYLRLGDTKKATEMVGRALNVARELNHKHEIGAALRTSGVIRLETSPPGEGMQSAEAELNESLSIFKELAMRLEEGRSCLALATLYRRTGEMDRCKECLLKSKEIFQRLGAMGELAAANQIQLR